MAEQYRFWDSATGDTRQYTAAQFAEVLHRFIGQGVLTGVANECVVAETGPVSLGVYVGTGEAFIQGYWYKNTAAKTVTLDAADPVLNRIDRIVLQVDLAPGLTGRDIIATKHTGTPAADPDPPALTRTALVYEISLAQVYVAAAAATISNANITDERYDNTLAGYAGPGVSKLCDNTITTVGGTKANMTTGRNEAAAGVYLGKVYVIGGWTGAAVSAKNEMYDPVLNTWTGKTDMTTARAALMAGVVGTKIYAIGGYTGGIVPSAKCEEYDPVGNAWAAKTDMITARYYLGGDVVASKIYCIGGTTGADFLQTNEEYTPATDAWAAKTNMTTGRYGPACAQVSNVIYCCGGIKAGPADSDLNEAYTPAADTWATKAVLPAVKVNHTAAAHGGYVYIFQNVTYKYDPVGDVWTTLDAPPTSRLLPVAATVGDAIYLIGNNGGGQVNEAFDAIPHYICQTAGPKIVTIVKNSATVNIVVDRGDATNFETISAVDAQTATKNATVRLNQWAATSIITLVG